MAALEREAIPADAYEAFENALRVLKKVSFSDQELIDRESDVYLGRGRTLFSQGRYDEALQDLQRSVSLASDMNLAQHAATHRLFIGEVQVRLDDPEAEASLEEAAHYAEQYGTPETRWRALYELALLRQLQGRSGEAVEGLRECIATIEGLRSQYLPEPLKISMLAAKEDVYSAIVQILCSSKGSENEVATRAMEAFDYAERAKSRVFAEQLAATDLDSIGIAGIPPKLLNQERELARELRLLRAEHLENLTKGTYDWGEEALKLESRLTKVRDRMRRTPEGDEYVALREAAALDYSGARTFLHANDRIGKPSG